MAERKKTTGQPNLDAIGLEMGKKPPQALDVERAVLGALLLDPACLDLVMEDLTPSCFYDPRHKMIFEAIYSLIQDHSPVDIVTATTKLKAQGNLEAVGGAVALSDLTNDIGSVAHVEFYVKLLKQKSIQRDLITAANNILKESFDEAVNVDSLMNKAQNLVYDAVSIGFKKDVEDIKSVINKAMASIEQAQTRTGISGVPSGYGCIDRITQGWQPSDLIILAARPSVGKTAFALNLARNAAVDHHIPVAIFSLEMSSIQLVKRLMTSESGLDADKIKGGVKLEGYEWTQLESKLRNLIECPLYIDDTPSIPVSEFRSKAKSLCLNKRVGLIIVDYLQLMQGPVELRGMREQEVASISRTLKATAKELNVPIIALSQLSRKAVDRTGGSGVPQLSDLRESGSIEQDADIVMFIHRPEMSGMAENAEDREKAKLVIAKHRNGAVDEIDLLFKAEQIKYVEPEDALYASQPHYVGSAMNEDSNDFLSDGLQANENF